MQQQFCVYINRQCSPISCHRPPVYIARVACSHSFPLNDFELKVSSAADAVAVALCQFEFVYRFNLRLSLFIHTRVLTHTHIYINGNVCVLCYRKSDICVCVCVYKCTFIYLQKELHTHTHNIDMDGSECERKNIILNPPEKLWWESDVLNACAYAYDTRARPLSWGAFFRFYFISFYQHKLRTRVRERASIICIFINGIGP